MAERWFDLVSAEHFWIIRRFDVLQKLCAPALNRDLRYAEVGCGSGILQRQLEKSFNLTVDGMDLGLHALEMTQATCGELYYYNILDQNPELKEKYDVIFLFDVLEHVDDENAFLKSCSFHLKRGGRLIVNVPSRMELYSKYDQAVGHVRRYRLKDFSRLAEASGLTVSRSTYWGLPLYPILLIRKVLIMFQTDASAIVQRGMKPPGNFANYLLKLYSRVEIIPQRIIGTSIMVIFQKR